MAENSQSCPLCRSDITAEGVLEGLPPAAGEAEAVADQEAAMQEEAGRATQDTSTAGCVLFESKLNALLDEVRLPASSDTGNCENGQPMPMAWHLKRPHCKDSNSDEFCDRSF